MNSNELDIEVAKMQRDVEYIKYKIMTRAEKKYKKAFLAQADNFKELYYKYNEAYKDYWGYDIQSENSNTTTEYRSYNNKKN